MKKNSLIKGILLVTIIAISMLITSNAYAAETIVLTQNSPANNAVANNTATNNSALSSTLTPTSTTNNTTSTLNQNLPKTGIADNTIVFAVVGICAVAAIYAYKKVRDYKGI